MGAQKPTVDELTRRIAKLESALEDCRAELFDCGERAEQLEASRKTDEELIRFLDAVTDGFILVDSDLRIIRASEGSSRSVGRRPQDVVGKKLDEVYMETRPSGRYEKYLEVLRTGKPFECDAVFREEWGEKHTSLKAARAGNSLGIATVDITDRKQAEAALREARKDWEAVFRAAGNPAFVLDPELRLISANQAATQALGMSADELRGKTCYELMHNSSAPPEDCPARQVLDGAPAPIEAEIEALGRTFLICCAPVRDDRGNVTKVIHVATDITERRQMEEALRESQAEERAFREQLAVLHEVELELSEAEAFDYLCRRAVGLGREKLGFDRLDLWFLTGNGLEVRGSFGVDAAGGISDERDTSGPVDPQSLMGKVLDGKMRLAVTEDEDLLNAAGEVVGRGGMAIASLWDGEEVIGCVCTDTLLRGGPVSAAQCQLLSLYASALGHLCSRERREQALREGERRYRTLLENLPQKIFSKDRDSVFLSCNENLARDLGIRPEEVQGKTDFDFFAEELAEKYQADDREVLESGNTRDIEERYIQDGKEVVVHTVKTPLRDAEGKTTGVLGIFWDITERKRAEEEIRRLNKDLERRVAERTADLEAANRELAEEIVERQETQEALRESEQRYRSLAESARESIFIINRDMTIRYLNSFGARQLRRTPAAVVGLSLDDIFPLEISREFRKELDAVLTTGQPASVEQSVAFLHAPDRTIWLDTQLIPLRNEAGRVNAVLGIARDITQRKRAEDALRESEERYRGVVEDQTELICRFQPTGELTFVNGAYCRYFGKKPEDLIGRGFMPLIPEEDRDKPRQCIAALSRDNPVRDVEHRVIDPAGGPHRWLRWTNRMILDEDGNPAEYLAVGRGITERKQAEAALRRTQREQAAILNSMTEHVVYHDKDMVIVWANRTACDSVGLAPEKIVGKTCYKLWQGRSSPCDGCPVKRTLETGGPHEEEMASPDGKQWFVRSSPVQDESGDLVGVVEISMDITERRRSEEALRESEQRFQQVAEHAQEWIWEVDAGGTYTYASPAVEKILGYQPAELVGKKHFYDLFHPEDREKLRKETLGAFARKEPFREFVNRNMRTDGETVWLSTSGVPVLDARGDLVGYRGADTDITRQRRGQEALRESEARYRALFEQAADSVLLIDSETGALLEFNDRAHENLGYSREEFDKLTLADIEAIESPDEAAAHVKAVAEQGSDTFETKQRRKDGDIRDVHVDSRAISVRGKKFLHAVWRDITEQKRTRERIDRQAAILANVTDAVAVAAEDHTVTYWSRGAEQMFGYTESDMLGRKGLDRLLRPEHDAAHTAREILEAVGTGGRWTQPRFPCRNKDGEEKWVTVTASALRPNPGEPPGTLLVARDVTEGVRLQERLIRAERLAAIGTLAAGVGHEMNNLLGGLRGLAELARNNRDLVPRLIDTCQAVTQRGGAIAGRLATLAGADAPGEERRLDLRTVVGTVVTMMDPFFGQSNIRVEEHYGPVPSTWANEGKILQVLLNLFVNARDSIGRDGTVTVSVRHDRTPDRIVIAVSDTGAGIRPEDVPRLFDPFFTTKRAADEAPSHLGLGLPESLNIVREYGGTLDVEGEPGRGATFTVRLPVRSAPMSQLGRRRAARTMPEKGTPVLVVDDDELMRFWLSEHLGERGCDVVAVGDGAAAARLCRDRTFPYVFLDLLMPGEMDGVATCARLRELRPEAKIIIITALPRASIPEDCLAAAYAVLKKPFGVEDVADALAGHGSSE